jgi:hypothetical protein
MGSGSVPPGKFEAGAKKGLFFAVDPKISLASFSAAPDAIF